MVNADFDASGFPKETTDSVSIHIGCRFAPKTSSEFVPSSGEVLCMSTYVGILRTLENIIKSFQKKSKNSPKNLSSNEIDLPKYVYEIGQGSVPFCIIFAHEIIHLKHFLETAKYKNDVTLEPPQGFISYGKALRFTNLSDIKSSKSNAIDQSLSDFDDFYYSIFTFF